MPYKIKDVRKHLRNWKKLVRLYSRIMQIEEGSCLIALWQLLEEAENNVKYFEKKLTELKKERLI